MSEYQIVDDLVDLVNHLTKVEISDEDWALATEGIVEAFGGGFEERVLTRMAMHATTILDALDTVKIWNDVLFAIEPENGVLRYILLGLERDPEYSWEEILNDCNRFYHADMMMKYEEGSFWKDVYYILDFLAEAFE